MPTLSFGRARSIVLLLGCLWLAGCGVPAANGPADTYGLDFSLPPGSTTSGVIVFIVDGLNAAKFQEMLDAGELPAIKKYFVDRGLYCPRTVANIPSVTLANLTSHVTGQFPGHHAIVGVNWFDRNQLLWRNYATIAQKNTLDSEYQSPNIFEQFPERTTFSVFFQPHRGTTKFIEDTTSAGPPFFFGWYEFVDRLTLSRLDIVADLARARKEFPAVTVCYLLAPDFEAYEFGANSKDYPDAIRHTDRQIGRVLGDLERAGLLDKVNIALVSDHGHTEVTRHFPLNSFFREKVGLELAGERLSDSTPFENRMDVYDRYSAVSYGGGDRYYALCLRKPVCTDGKFAGWSAWPTRPSPEDLMNYPVLKGGDLLNPPARTTVDLPKTAIEQPAVDALAYAAGPDAVRVRTRAGEVEFRQPGGRGTDISCRTVSGQDPLGYKGKVADEALAGKPLAPRQWLEQTHATCYPDLPAQILAYFRSRRAGDIILFAAPGCDFYNAVRSGHGGIRPEDMFVPMLIAGPGVKKQTLPVARSADLMPTLLQLMGKPIPPNLDGRSLLSKEENPPNN